MGRLIDLEWKRCELDTMMDAQWVSSWPAVLGKWISFQPVGPWMGYLFTDLGAEGCCRSLNAFFYHTFTQRSWRVCVLDSPCLSVCLSVCGQNCVHWFSTVLAALTSYLHILIVHRVLWDIKNLNFGNFFKSSPLTMSCVHLMWLLKVDSSSQLLLQQILMVCDDASKYMFRVWPKLQFCIFGIFFSIVPFH